MQIENINPKKLKPWSKNPRINDHAVDVVVKSITEFGFNSPILCDSDYRILAGHTRWKAAKKMQLSKVPVIVIQLTETQKNAFAIADNKTAEIAKWDLPVLIDVLEELKLEEFDLDLTCFDSAHLDAMLLQEPEINWSEFEENMLSNYDSEYVRLLVKVPIKTKDMIKTAIQNAAEKMQLRHADHGILAGQVLKQLLEDHNVNA